MTVNFSSDLDDDDFLNNTFRNISENDLLSFDVSSSPSRNLSNQLELKQVQFEIHNQSLNSTLDSNKNNHDLVKSSTSVNSKSVNPSKKDSLSFLFKKRKENDTLNHEEIFIGDDISNLNQDTIIDKTSKINSRFVPGCTPKAKKRKLPGPAGFFSTNTNMPCDSDPLLTASTNSEIEIQNITNSQFSAEDLLLPSWQNLQRDVSSCQALLSTAKYYSIRRVLHETSKKKLPKHLVVPILCVLIKKFDPEESALNFIDDTGEISGKINKEVLDTYKDCIKSGTALILKKITCLCNILFLKKQNIVSIYLEDGSATHVQDLNTILDKEKPLNPMNCGCPGTPKEKALQKHATFKECNSSSISSKKFCASKDVSEILSKATSKQYNINNKIPKGNKCTEQNSCNLLLPEITDRKENVLGMLEAMLDISQKESHNVSNTYTEISSGKQSTLDVRSNNSTETFSTPIIRQNLASKELILKKSNPPKAKQCTNRAASSSVVKTSFEEDLFCEDTGMDDFDELLCSLDEQSFLEEI